MILPFLFEEVFIAQKARRLGCRRAWWFLISLAFSVQAMAVRRHGGPVMMVVTVMAVALHLLNKVSVESLLCQQ
jgi:hypothetical protein